MKSICLTHQFVQLWSFVFLFCLRVWQNGVGPSWTTLYILGACLQMLTYCSKITEERMLALNPKKPPSVHFNQAGRASVFVEPCDASTLLGTVTWLFIPASLHFLLFKCTMADLCTESPHSCLYFTRGISRLAQIVPLTSVCLYTCTQIPAC